MADYIDVIVYVLVIIGGLLEANRRQDKRLDKARAEIEVNNKSELAERDEKIDKINDTLVERETLILALQAENDRSKIEIDALNMIKAKFTLLSEAHELLKQQNTHLEERQNAQEFQMIELHTLVDEKEQDRLRLQKTNEEQAQELGTIKTENVSLRAANAAHERTMLLLGEFVAEALAQKSKQETTHVESRQPNGDEHPHASADSSVHDGAVRTAQD